MKRIVENPMSTEEQYRDLQRELRLLGAFGGVIDISAVGPGDLKGMFERSQELRTQLGDRRANQIQDQLVGVGC